MFSHFVFCVASSLAGWGNSIRALFVSTTLSLITGRRMIVRNHAFERTFHPPKFPAVKDWDYGAPSQFTAEHVVWSYADHGQNPGCVSHAASSDFVRALEISCSVDCIDFLQRYQVSVPVCMLKY
jgi:hypothetical protein